MKLIEASLEDLGFQIEAITFTQYRQIHMLARKRDVEDCEPEIVCLRNNGREFALVAHQRDGHGTFSFFEVK